MKWLRPTLAVPIRMLVLCIFASLVAVTTIAAETATPPLFVGVLEDAESDNPSPVMSMVHVRVAFQKQRMEWIPFKTDFNTPKALAESYKYYPEVVNWIVVFDGKKIGTIASKNLEPGPLHYGDVGTQTITTEHTLVPKVSIGAADFSDSGNAAKVRPLVLVSAPHSGDPDGWHPTTLSAVEKRIAIKNFRNQFPLLKQCDKPEEEPIKMVPYQ